MTATPEAWAKPSTPTTDMAPALLRGCQGVSGGSPRGRVQGHGLQERPVLRCEAGQTAGDNAGGGTSETPPPRDFGGIG